MPVIHVLFGILRGFLRRTSLSLANRQRNGRCLLDSARASGDCHSVSTGRSSHPGSMWSCRAESTACGLQHAPSQREEDDRDREDSSPISAAHSGATDAHSRDQKSQCKYPALSMLEATDVDPDVVKVSVAEPVPALTEIEPILHPTAGVTAGATLQVR